MDVRLYLAQRISAALMLPLVAVHILVVLYAVGEGLTAAEILARTRGSLYWALFYGLFVAAAAIHAAIGVRSVAREWTPLRGRTLDYGAIGFGVILALLGARAVAAVVL
jgi:fumarate reductase subunit C